MISVATGEDMENKRCRRDVKTRVRQQLQALPMGRPENKPDLGAEDAERPKAGEGTKTAALVKAALSKGLLQRAAVAARVRARGAAHAMEDLGSRAVVPRELKSEMGQQIAKLRTQADVFAGGGKGVMPKATRAKQMRETVKSMGPRVNIAEAEAAQMAGSYGDSVRAMNAKMDARALANDATRAGRAVPAQGATAPGIAPPPLPGTNAVTPSQARVPQPAAAPSSLAGQTYAGGSVPQVSSLAEATRLPGPAAPLALSPERAAALRAASPQSYGKAPPVPAPRPTLGRSALVLGSAGLAGSMMNRQPQQSVP